MVLNEVWFVINTALNSNKSSIIRTAAINSVFKYRVCYKTSIKGNKFTIELY